MSEELKATVNHLELLTFELSVKQHSLKNEERRKQLLLEQIVQRIRLGESTGDRFRDFVILQRHFDSREESASVYASVNERIEKSRGQLILLVERWVEHHDLLSAFDFGPTKVGGYYHEVFRLGALRLDASLELDYSTLQLWFPTKAYAEGNNVIEDQMQLMHFPNTHLYESLTKMVAMPYGESAPALSLYIGNDEINQAPKEYLLKAYQLSQLLGHVLPMSEKLESALEPQRRHAIARFIEFLEHEKEFEKQLNAQRIAIKTSLEAVGLNYDHEVEAFNREQTLLDES